MRKRKARIISVFLSSGVVIYILLKIITNLSESRYRESVLPLKQDNIYRRQSSNRHRPLGVSGVLLVLALATEFSFCLLSFGKWMPLDDLGVSKRALWPKPVNSINRYTKTSLIWSTFRKNCKPKKNIVFVKTHKTGSSTVTNILHRHGDKHELVFALPRDGQFRLDWPWSMRNSSFHVIEGTRPNIVCHHGRYDRETLARIMPRDTVYVTIIRHPISQYESTFNYMGFDKLLGNHDKDNPLVHFLENPDKILVNYLLTEDLRVNSDRLKLIRNGMAFDLGLNSTYFDNSGEIENFLGKLKNEFDLVLVAEFFDESLILLKELLCWPLEDITYFKLNVRQQDENRTLFTAKTISNMKHWNNVDFRIYRQFHDILKAKIAKKTQSKDGARFEAELKELRVVNARMRELCLRNVTKTVTLQYGVVVEKMELNGRLDPSTRTMCDKIRRNEVDFIKYLRNKQSSFVRTMFLNKARDEVIKVLRLLLGLLSKN